MHTQTTKDRNYKKQESISRVYSDSFSELVNCTRLNLYNHGRIVVDERWCDDNVILSQHVLLLVKSGGGVYETPKKRLTLRAGWAFLVPMHTEVSFSCSSVMEKYYFFFRLEYHGLTDLIELNPPVHQERPVADDIWPLLESYGRTDVSSNLGLEGLLLGIIAGFLPRTAVPQPVSPPEKFHRISAYINNNCRADLTLGDVARSCGLTSGYLSSLCKKTFGRNFKEIITAKILDRSRKELRSSSRKVREIAGSLGFNDELYFSKYFKKHCGMSPLEYRAGREMYR